MNSILILFLGTFWEASMDIISVKKHYEQSIWKSVANYFDFKNFKFLGNQFWDNTISQANKWKNKDPKQGEAFFGSSTILVSIVDGWHLMKLVWLMHVFAAISCFEKISSYLLIDLLILYGVFGIGHEIFGKLIKLRR